MQALHRVPQIPPPIYKYSNYQIVSKFISFYIGVMAYCES